MTDPFLESAQRRAARLSAEHAAARAAYRDAQQAAADADGAAADAIAAQEILQNAAAAVQASAHAQVARVVSSCLAAVFGPAAYRMEVEFQEKRGRTEAALAFVRDGARFDPLASCGGGVVDVAAFALRLAALVLSRPPRRRFLVLDEPFRHLSRDHAGRVGELLLTLCRELDLQILMSTHTKELAVGHVVSLEG